MDLDDGVRSSTSSRRNKKNGWNDDVDDQKPSVVGQREELVIPDLQDIQDDFDTTIAVIPQQPTVQIRTMSELESDLGQSSLNIQIQNTNIPGLDLSNLIRDALVPAVQLDESDQPWEWDILVTAAQAQVQ